MRSRASTWWCGCARPAERVLPQKAHKRAAGAASRFFCIQCSVIVGVGSLEALLDDREVLVLCERAVLVGIGSRQFLRVQAPAQLAPVKRAVLVAVEPVEQRGCCFLRFG